MEIRVDTTIVPDDIQLKALEECQNVKNRIVAVTGPAGSGKTTIIRQLTEDFQRRSIPIILCAPTGKAARRIKEATGIDAITIHKLLEYNRPGERDPKTGDPLDPTFPKRNRQNPLTYKVVVVDEYAMVNYELHNNIIAALPSGGVLRAFGDVNQLPPIESYKLTDRNGRTLITPFEKLIAEQKSIRLEKVYRQGEGSNILESANRIRKGHTPVINRDLGDFFIRVTDKPIDMLRDFIVDQRINGIDYRLIDNQVITSSRKSWVGTHKLNSFLRNILNPSPDQTLELPRYSWDKDPVTIGLGDKVVCTENTYDLRDYFERYSEWDPNTGAPYPHSYIPCPETKTMLNGETGVVSQIYPDGGIDVDFGDRIVEIPNVINEYWAKRDTIIEVQPLRAIDLAYALTTHKCQGSEFKEICYVLNKSTKFSQSRQNLYTAVTRARNKVTVLTDQTSIRYSIAMLKKG